MNQLIEIDETTVLEAFTGDKIDELLCDITTEARRIVLDVSTAKGRKDIASLAAKVAKAKTFMDGVGKELVTDWKAKAKVIDNKRKHVRDTLDGLKVEVRQKLTDWEEAEANRVRELEAKIAVMGTYAIDAKTNWQTTPLESMRMTLQSVEEIMIDGSWDEYETQATDTRADAIKDITAAIAQRVQHDTDQAELAQMRQDQAEREQRDRDERLQREAAAQATKDAEQRTQQAEQDARDAEQRALEAEQRTSNAASEAQRVERERTEQKQRDKDAEDARRAADVEHRRKINSKAKADFVKELGEDQERLAEFIVQMIASGKISNIKINY